jgi:hypothetical protein
MTFVFGTRIAAVVVLAANVGIGPAFAPEHLHERDEHHSSAILHSHLAPHQAQRSPDGARFDDDDDHVIWVTTAWLQTPFYHVRHLTTAAAIVPIPPPPAAHWTAIVLDDAAPPHGPPRTHRSSRAPPLPA